MQLDERKYRILQAIIDDYILTAVPVGSRTISRKYDMGLSSATIRNEMSDLEELGYLDQPHVSAGRVPSAKAYRLYVNNLMSSGELQDDSGDAIRDHFSNRMHQMEDVINRAAQVLSSMTHYASVVMAPKGMDVRIRNIQLVPVSDTSALVVIVTNTGIVRDSVIRVSEKLNSDSLYAISRMLTERLSGCTPEEAIRLLPNLAGTTQVGAELAEGLGGLVEDVQQTTGLGKISIGGASNMLSYPEYSDVEKARQFFTLMEAKDKLANLLEQDNGMAFTVRIGPETGVPELQDCSLVTATYSVGDNVHGTLGVIGPTRMEYGKVISILNTMGQQLSALFEEERKR